MKVICMECGLGFNKSPKDIKRVKRIFCSKNCFDTVQRRESIQLGRSVLYTCIVCDNAFLVKKSQIGRHSTCSKDCQRINRTKEKNPNWRGGITKERKSLMTVAEYKIWRISVFERDNYTCQNCGKRGNGELHAHHIKEWIDYPELRYEVNNGVTLCKECHINHHTKSNNDQADGFYGQES